MKVLITGAGGNLGVELVRAFESQGHDVTPCERDVLDITDSVAVFACLRDGNFDAAVNAAAFNDVDGMEDRQTGSRTQGINIHGPGNLAAACRQSQVPFVHYSTDYVFAGTRPEGYVETDQPEPLSAYGWSKHLGERMVQAAHDGAYVVRTSKLFGSPGLSNGAKPSFVSLMLKLAKEKPELSIVHEEVGCPTFTKDLAEATVQLLAGYPPGIYHLVNEGAGVTWYEFAEEIFGLAGVTTPRKPVLSSAFPPRPAKRPMHAALLNTKGPKLRHRLEALKAFLGQP